MGLTGWDLLCYICWELGSVCLDGLAVAAFRGHVHLAGFAGLGFLGRICSLGFAGWGLLE